MQFNVKPFIDSVSDMQKRGKKFIKYKQYKSAYLESNTIYY